MSAVISKVARYFTGQLVSTEEAIPVALQEERGHDAILVYAALSWTPCIPLSWIDVEGDAVIITV